MNDEERSAAIGRLAKLKLLINEAERKLLSLRDDERRLQESLAQMPAPLPPTPGPSQANPRIEPRLPLLPPVPTPAEMRAANRAQVGVEIDFGKWLARIGILFALITVISFSTVFFTVLGPLAKVFVLIVVSLLMFWGGSELERRDPKVMVFARTLAGGGLACLYFTLYGATNLEQLRVIDSPFLGGILLLAWSGFVLYIGEKKQSELLSFFAIALAYFSSAINPTNNFMLGADLLLAVTAVALLIRNSWLSLSYFCLVATYIGLLASVFQYNYDGSPKQIIVQFWPCVAYLMTAWLIHTVGLYSVIKIQPKERRLPYQFLNNAGLAGLTILSAGLSNFGHFGTIFFALGCLLCAMAVATGRVLPACPSLAGWSFFQGAMLITAAIIEHFSGHSRAIILSLEMIFIVSAGTYSKAPGLKALGYMVSFFALYVILIQVSDHPDSVGLLAWGFIAGLVCGFIVRRQQAGTSGEAVVFLLAASLFLGAGASDYGGQGLIEKARADITIALVGLAMTLLARRQFYQELILGGQILLLIAGLSLVNGSTDAPSVWAKVIVVLILALVSFLLMRRGRILSLPELEKMVLPLVCVYGGLSALIALTAIVSDGNPSEVVAGSAAVSLGFFFFGRMAGPWPFALAGQLLLGCSVFLFLAPWNGGWSWWAEAVPICVVLVTAWLFEHWSKQNPDDFGQTGLAGFAYPLPEVVGKAVQPTTVVYRMFTVALFAKFLDPRLTHDQLSLAMLALGLVLVILEEFLPFSAAALCALSADVIAAPTFLDRFSTLAVPWHLACIALMIGQVIILVKSKTRRPVALAGINFVTSACILGYTYSWSVDHLATNGQIAVCCVVALLLTAMGILLRLIQPVVVGQLLLISGVGIFVGDSWGLTFTRGLTYFNAILSVPAWWCVFSVGWMLNPKLAPELWQIPLRNLSRGYRIVGILLLAIWVARAFPDWAVCCTLMVLGTGISLANLPLRNLFGARCGVGLAAIGVFFYLTHRIHNEGWAELVDGLGFACLILQSTLFRYLAKDLVPYEERSIIVAVSCVAGWLFVGNAFPWIHYATMVWAIYAVWITAMGFAFNERAQRVIGLIILGVAIIRVGLFDFWEFPGLLKVFTFFALTVGCLSLSYLYHRFGERMKEWL